MKNLFQNRKKNVQVYFLIAIGLLINYFILDLSFHKKSQENLKEVSGYYINKQFYRALSNLGIEKNWIIHQKISQKAPDSLKYSYLVKVPADLPIPVILDEIKITVDSGWSSGRSHGNVKLESEEKIINGKSILKAYSGNEIKLSAQLNYDNDIKRKQAEVGILIQGLQKLSAKEDSVILSTPEDFAVVITPDKNSPAFIKEILANEKQYALLLNDNISDLDYKLNPGYSQQRLKLSIKNIAGTFLNSICFFFDTNSDLYKSSSYQYIANEFKMRNIKLLTINLIKNISNDSKNPIQEFDSFLGNLKDGSKKLVLISAENFGSALDIIIKYQKLGYKFVNPSLIIDYYIPTEKSKSSLINSN
jgi:hypothetical protein